MWFFDWGGNCPPCPPASYGLGHWHVAERLVNLKAINPFAPVLMSRKHIRHYSFYFRITKTNMTEIEWVTIGPLKLGNASWECLHEVLPIVIVRESRMFTCVLSLPQWRFYHNFEPLVSHTNVHAGCGRSWRTFLEQFRLRYFSPPCTYWGQVYWHNATLVHSYIHGDLHSLGTNWIMQNRGDLDILVHPNSGAEVLDHTDWSLWWVFCCQASLSGSEEF